MSDLVGHAWTLMTAMPPTKGHIALIKWMTGLPNVREVHVVVTTQPGEPYAVERFNAIKAEGIKMAGSRVIVHHLHRELPQDPATDGFWDMWWDMMLTGDDGRWFDHIEPGDYFVSSEPYGAKLAEGTGAIFMPYDPNRELVNTKATVIRLDPLKNFAGIADEFQHNLRTTVTFWGAESTGKTTLSKEVAGMIDAPWLYEYARPYLETVGKEITIPKMEAIWRGQAATQLLGADFHDNPYLVQDTDLFSTVGYWEQAHWAEELGECPAGLIKDAQRLKSDLYLITRSNIPFEQDDIRYGVDHRESPDAYWIGLADKYNLPYKVLNESDLRWRVSEAMEHIRRAGKDKAMTMQFERQSNG